MSNYPDDIRQYDHDPRSTFYEDRYERYMEIFAHKIAIDPEIMIDVLADSEQRYDNIVKILCMLVEKVYSHGQYEREIKNFLDAWMELAEEAAKRHEENNRI